MPNIIYKAFYDKFDHFNYEKRKLSEKPKFDYSKLDKYPYLFEKYFNDYIPFRNELIKTKNYIDIYFFKNIFSSYYGGKSFIGTNDYIFYFINKELLYDYIGSYVIDDITINKIKNNLVFFRNELKKLEIDFILMITPDKYNIYSEYMPEYIRRKSVTNNTDRIIEYISNSTDLKLIYLKNELINYKNKYQLYYKYDLHWNNISGYIGYQYLMKFMKKNCVDIGKLQISNWNYYEYIPAYIANTFYINTLNIKYNISGYSTNKFINYNSTNVNGYDDHYIESISTSNDETRILILGDSFTLFGDMYSYIGLNFKNCCYVNLNVLYLYSLKELINSFDPDVVIYQTLESVFIRRMSNLVIN